MKNLATFNTSIGLMAVVVNGNNTFKVGDIIENQDGIKYKIVSIHFPFKPPINGRIGLKLQKLQNSV